MRKIPWWVWAVAGCIVIGGIVARYASSLPDGLEAWVEEAEIPVAETEQPSPLADYETPGVKREGASIFIAAAVGILVVFGLTYGVGKLLARREEKHESAL